MVKDTVLMGTLSKKVQFKPETLMEKEMTYASPIASKVDLTMTIQRCMFFHRITNGLPVERKANQTQAMKTAFMFVEMRTPMGKATANQDTLSMKAQFLR
jgi:hypothetical protein